MPTRKAESFDFGGVDSRSNPANYPFNRSLRCLNFAPQQSGALRLRSGYSVPMAATNDSVGATAIHSLIYYEQFAAALAVTEKPLPVTLPVTAREPTTMQFAARFAVTETQFAATFDAAERQLTRALHVTVRQFARAYRSTTRSPTR